MSMQRVNLYLPEFRPRKEWLTASTILFSSLGFACLLCLFSFFLAQSLARKEIQVALLESQAVSSADRMARFSQNARPVSAARLNREIKDLEEAVRAREQIDQIIRGQNLGNEEGFSESMLNLARQSLPSISLAHIRISRGGAFIEAKGLTNAAHDVPTYIKALRKQPSFANTQFGLLSLVEDEKARRMYSFSMGFDAMSNLATTSDSQ